MIILSLTLNIVVWFGGIHLILIYIKLKNYREEPVSKYLVQIIYHWKMLEDN